MLVLSATQACHCLSSGSLKLTHGGTSHRRGRCGHEVHLLRRSWVGNLDVGRRLWKLALGFDEARLKIDNVVA